MHNENQAPRDVLRDVWARLAGAVGRSDDPRNTPVLSTCDAGGSHSRIVVVRAVDPSDRTVMAYTDVRSHKVRQIAHRPRVSWLFWDPHGRTQTRMEGEARVHAAGALVEREWSRTNDVNRRLYTGPPPGTTQPDAGRSARDNFSIVRCVVDRIDWLDLNVPGHRRAVLMWNDGQWQGEWVSP